MDDTSYVNLSLEKYNELYDKSKKYENEPKLTDETGYSLISEIIKSHLAEHSNDDPKVYGSISIRCQQALNILDMLKYDE